MYLFKYEIAYKGLIKRSCPDSLKGSNTGSVEKTNITCNCAGKCANDNLCKFSKSGVKCTSQFHLKIANRGKKQCKHDKYTLLLCST